MLWMLEALNSALNGLCCEECGSLEVQAQEWYDMNTGESAGPAGDGVWCEGCQSDNATIRQVRDWLAEAVERVEGLVEEYNHGRRECETHVFRDPIDGRLLHLCLDCLFAWTQNGLGQGLAHISCDDSERCENCRLVQQRGDCCPACVNGFPIEDQSCGACGRTRVAS